MVPARSSRLGLPPARRRHLLPDALAALDRRLRRAGRQHRDEPASGSARRRGPGASRSRRRGCGLRVFAGPRPADVLRRLTARGSGASRRRRRRWCFGPWYQPTGDDEQAILAACGGRDVPGVGRPDLHALPALRRPRGSARRRARAARPLPPRGPRGDHLLQPDGLHEPQPRTPRPRPRRAGAATSSGGPYVYRYSTLEGFLVGAVRLHRAPGRRLLRRACCARRSPTATTAGWRTSASTRRSTPLRQRARRARRCTTSTRASTTAPRFAGGRAPAAGALRALGLDRQRPAARRSCGAATRRVDWGFDGLRSVVHQRADHGAVGGQHLGLGHRRLLRAVRNRLTPELLIRWIQVGAVSGVMRTQANGIRIPDSAAAAGLGRRRAAGHWRRCAKLRTQLYPYLAAADAQLPAHRAADHAPPGAGLPGRPARRRARRRSSCSAPTCWPRRCSTRGAAPRALYLPRGRWVDLWRSARYRERDGGLSLAPGARCCAAGAA